MNHHCPLPNRLTEHLNTVWSCPGCDWSYRLHPIVRRWFRYEH